MSVRRVVGRSVSLVMIVCVCPSLAKAEEIGRFGQTYPIQEKDMLAAIYEKLAGLEQSGWLANKQKEMLRDFQASMKGGKFSPKQSSWLDGVKKFFND